MKCDDIRTMKCSTDDGKNVKSTQKLKGNATSTPAEKEQNSTVQSVGSKKVTGPFGGEAVR